MEGMMPFDLFGWWDHSDASVCWRLQAEALGCQPAQLYRRHFLRSLLVLAKREPTWRRRTHNRHLWISNSDLFR
jgi:hypothetical protein